MVRRVLLPTVLSLALAACPGKQRPDEKPGRKAAAVKQKPEPAPRTEPKTRPQPKAKERPNPLKAVRFWAYQIQHLDRDGAVDRLVRSRYDMLVLEPTRTDRDSADFDSKGMVERLHATRGKSGKRRIVIAYIDIGEAESWRYYWKRSWKKPTKSRRGQPDFLVIPDPDGWEDNYPVAYWDPRWKAIIASGEDSMLDRILDDGYDGIYLDWVEAFSNDAVRRVAREAGRDSAVEMIRFIGELRAHARKRRPDFLVIPQNAAALLDGHPEYLNVIDAIAQEQIFFDGDADTKWGDRKACDRPVPARGEGYSQAHYAKHLAPYQRAGLPVFNVEYACSRRKVKIAYERSAKLGYVTYVSRRPLSRLTTTPPPGY
jgi:cysteinyl-tRNA synthetase